MSNNTTNNTLMVFIVEKRPQSKEITNYIPGQVDTEFQYSVQLVTGLSAQCLPKRIKNMWSG